MELAPCVRQASGFRDAMCKQRLVARVVVAHQRAAPGCFARVAQELHWIAAGATFGEVEHHGLLLRVARRAIAPQVCTVRLASAGIEHRHRCLVGVQDQLAQQLISHCIHQRLQRNAAAAHPLRQCRA